MDGGKHFDSVKWNDLREINSDCPAPLGFRGDTDIVVPRAIFAPGGYQHAYATALYASGWDLLPRIVVVVRTGASGRFDEATIQCERIPEPESVNVIDKTTAALTSTFDEDALWVAYQDGRTRKVGPDAPIAHNWLQKVRLSADGSLGQAESPQMLQAPGEEGPAQTIWGDCTPQDADDMGRGNLYATATGTLYLAFSNNLGTKNYSCTNLETRRIYVAKLNGANRFISCVDEYLTSECANQGHIEESDAEMIVDPQTQKIAVVYAKPGFETEPQASGRRIVLATSNLDGQSWTKQLAYAGRAIDDDQSQPAIALTTFSDAIDRVLSGTIFITWYQPAAGGRVKRYGRGFYRSGSGWRAVTGGLWASHDSFYPIGPGAPLSQTNRGVYEYQGVAHAPGLLDGGGGWVGAWTQPSPASLANPSDSAYRIAYASWL